MCDVTVCVCECVCVCVCVCVCEQKRGRETSQESLNESRAAVGEGFLPV